MTMTCTCHLRGVFCTAHFRYTDERVGDRRVDQPHKVCTCRTGAAEHSLDCPAHGIGRTVATNSLRNVIPGELASRVVARRMAVAGMTVTPADLAERVILDLVAPHDLAAPVPVPEVTAPCGCDMPGLFGHDTDCIQHPAPIASEPLQMLISATELIDNQPTAEQWQTIKKAILALARLETTARSE